LETQAVIYCFVSPFFTTDSSFLLSLSAWLANTLRRVDSSTILSHTVCVDSLHDQVNSPPRNLHTFSLFMESGGSHLLDTDFYISSLNQVQNYIAFVTCFSMEACLLHG